MNIEFQKFLDLSLEETCMKEKRLKLLQEIKQVFIKDRNQLEEAISLDFQKWKKKIDVDKMIEIIDRYYQIEKENKKEKKIALIEKVVVSYYGNPYVTLHISLQAILYQKQVLLETGEFMLSVNSFIINGINVILKENRVSKLLMHCIQILDKKAIVDKKIKTILIGTNNYKAQYFGKYTYIPYNNYIIYCLDEELEELCKTIYEYASNNLFETEVVFEEEIEEAIEYINLKKDKIAIILTKDIKLQNIVKEKIKNKLYINENPFSKEEVNIPTNCLEF